MDKDNITLNPDKLNKLNSDAGLPLVIKTLESLKNVSFTSDYHDLINTPNRLSDFENDIGASSGGNSYAIYKEFTELYKYTYNSEEVVDGVVKYTLPSSFKPKTDSVEVYLYNIRLIENNDYTISDNEITLNFIPPNEGDQIINVLKRMVPITEVDEAGISYPLLDGYVPDTRTIAGLALTDDITTEELKEAGIMGTSSDDFITSDKSVIGAVNEIATYWSLLANALNSTIGTDSYKSLDKLMDDKISAVNSKIDVLASTINSMKDSVGAIILGLSTLDTRINNLYANVDNINSNISFLIANGGSVKRVQRGEATIPGTGSSIKITLAYPINVDKSLVILNGSGYKLSYSSSSASNRYGYNYDPTYELTSTTLTIHATISDIDRDPDPETYIGWQIIEFN